MKADRLAACAFPVALLCALGGEARAEGGPEAPAAAGFLPVERLEQVVLGPTRLDLATGAVKRLLGRAIAGPPGRVSFRLRDRQVGEYRLAVIPVEFQDVRRNEAFALADYERALFSEGTYAGTSPSGDKVYGSMRDYYLENSCGRFRLSGKVFDWVRASRARGDYAKRLAFLPGLNSLPSEAARALERREGAGALDAYDGIAFVIAGTRGPRGGVLWPHSSSFFHRGRLRDYYLMEEGGKRFAPIGVHCHEFGHMLGILDKYGLGHRTGIGVFCVMAVGHRGIAGTDLATLGAVPAGDHRPFHFCAFCKERLGWLTAATVDPRLPQKVALGPVEGSAADCLKVLIDPDGSEYFLLENRQRRGFDAEFPRSGLLIWHVGEWGQRLRNFVYPYRIDLEEAHGYEGPDGAHRDLSSIPFPANGRRTFAPWTHPGSGSVNPRALPVRIDGIEEAGERILFRLGFRDF